MKKLILATAVTALSVSAAQAAPTVYGKAFLTVDAISEDTEVTNKVTNQKDPKSEKKSRPALKSNSSRIGFKGKEALTDNTDIIYQLEYKVNIDDGSKAQFEARDTYLGLSNAQLGTLKAGRLTAIDDAVDFANVTVGGVRGGDKVYAPALGRANNAFAYASPSYDGMQLLAMYALDEDKAGSEVSGIAGKYEPAGQPFKAGASYIHRASAAKGTIKDAIRVSGAFAVSPEITVGALYQVTDYDKDDKENGFTISGTMKTGTPWTAYAQGDMLSNVKGTKDDDKFRVAVGGKYAFNKATTGHVYGAFDKEEKQTAAAKTEITGFGIGGGLEYKF